MSSMRSFTVVDRELSRKGTTRRKTMGIVLVLGMATKAETSQHCGEHQKYNSRRLNRLTNYKAIREERARERRGWRGREAESKRGSELADGGTGREQAESWRLTNYKPDIGA